LSLGDDIEALRRHLDNLAEAPDEEFLERYTLRRPPRPPGLYWQLRWLAGRILRWFESKGILRADPWPVSLAHARTRKSAKPLLIWAVGADRDTLHEACRGLSGLLDANPGFAPVLVTDVADFAFYSRLGWLVEYLPAVAGEGKPFEVRKAIFVARLYRGAPALPVRAGLAPESAAQEIGRLLTL
jgi:hypothetical protein